jgi:hypothetical protein
MIRLAVVTAVLLLAPPAWAEPLPVRKIGQCPSGYLSGADLR